jgi:hypothetical protein
MDTEASKQSVFITEPGKTQNLNSEFTVHETARQKPSKTATQQDPRGRILNYQSSTGDYSTALQDKIVTGGGAVVSRSGSALASQENHKFMRSDLGFQSRNVNNQ